MAIVIKNTNYSGEVLEKLLTKAATGNELVEKGLIRIEPGVSDKFSIPRIKGGRMLQKRKEQPVDGDSKGDFGYDERVLKPEEFMAFTTFNPRTFEKIWRKWQPKGNLVFADLPPEAQNALLDEMAKCVDFELGIHFINGIFVDDDSDDDHLFNGIVCRMLSDSDVIPVKCTEKTMIKRLRAVRKATPKVLRNNPKFRYLMSVNDADTYDDELTDQTAKGANHTDMNSMRFKGTTIVPLANWPDGLIVGTLCGMDIDTNLWAAVNLQDDMDVIQIDKLTNAGEKYFFKMLMKADTQTAFGDEVVMLDLREAEKAKVAGSTVTMTEYVATVEGTPAADTSWNVTGDGVLLGARLTVTNKAADKVLTVGGVPVPGGKTVTISYNGKDWFSTEPEEE